MALAYNNFLNPPRHLDWNFADRRQQEVIYGGYEGFLIVKVELKKKRITMRFTIPDLRRVSRTPNRGKETQR
jgi:hypothetical protein